MGPTTTMTVYDELVAALQKADPNFLTQQAGETTHAYYERMILGVSKLPDGDWSALSGNAQEWFNLAGAAFNGLQTPPVCPGFEPVPEVAAAPTPGVPQAPTPAPKAGEGSRAAKRGIMQKAREIALNNPEQKVAVLISALNDVGYAEVSEDTAWICLQEVRNVLKAAESAGFHLVKFNPAS